jgi:hypothetical protein
MKNIFSSLRVNGNILFKNSNRIQRFESKNQILLISSSFSRFASSNINYKDDEYKFIDNNDSYLDLDEEENYNDIINNKSDFKSNDYTRDKVVINIPLNFDNNNNNNNNEIDKKDIILTKTKGIDIALKNDNFIEDQNSEMTSIVKKSFNEIKERGNIIIIFCYYKY